MPAPAVTGTLINQYNLGDTTVGDEVCIVVGSGETQQRIVLVRTKRTVNYSDEIRGMAIHGIALPGVPTPKLTRVNRTLRKGHRLIIKGGTSLNRPLCETSAITALYLNGSKVF